MADDHAEYADSLFVGGDGGDSAAPTSEQWAARSHRVAYVQNLVKELLPTVEIGQSVYQSKLYRQSVLLDNPPSSASSASAVAVAAANTTAVLPTKRLGVRGRDAADRQLSRLPPVHASEYERYVPLHALWLQYITDIVNDDPRQVAVRMLRADLHGAVIRVIRSVNPSLVGIEGIVIKETQYTFVVVTRTANNNTDTDNQKKKKNNNSKFKTLLKKGTWFEMAATDACKVTLYGDQLCLRPAERARRKFKNTDGKFV